MKIKLLKDEKLLKFKAGEICETIDNINVPESFAVRTADGTDYYFISKDNCEIVEFLKSDLKTGMVVLRDDGSLWLVLKDYLSREEHMCPLFYFTDKLELEGKTIIKVWDIQPFDLNKLNSDVYWDMVDPIWTRPSPPPPEKFCKVSEEFKNKLDKVIKGLYHNAYSSSPDANEKRKKMFGRLAEIVDYELNNGFEILE